MKQLIFLIVLTFILSLVNSQGIHVSGSKLLDANGNEFIFRGVNLAHAWYTDKTKFSINEISSLGANSARIVLACGAKWTKTSYSELEKIINWCENEGLICVMELHDFTGSDNPSDITETALDYWSEMKNLLNKHKKYIIINIANEWMGSWNKGSIYRDAYVSGIKSMRAIGIENAIMVDASGYGQETGPIIENAKKILEADPDKNVIFSYHVYSVLGKDENSLFSGFDGLKKTGVCWIVGEFGWFHSGANVAYKSLMDYCQKNKIGWIAWSWSGNGGDDAVLDLTDKNTFSKNDLSNWGKDVFYGDNGIKNTSKKAYGNGEGGNNKDDDDDNYGYCEGCEITATGTDGSKWGWENGKSCRIDLNKCEEDSGTAPNGYPYCTGCEVTVTTDDGSKWGWENNKSCVIDLNKCGGDSGTAPNGYPYCTGCEVTVTTDDGTRWGWENNKSCVINDSKC